MNGRIGFFLAYDFQLKQLYLNLIKVRQLRATIAHPPSTFVQVDIGPKFNGTFSTKRVKNNANPDYITELIFHVDLPDLFFNVLKLTVYEMENDFSRVPIGTIYYPLEHLLVAQRTKGHVVWRDLLPGMHHSTTMGLIEIRAKIWYDTNEECLNIDVHSLHALKMIDQAYHVYVHVQSIAAKESLITDGKCGPIVPFEQSDSVVYNQAFRFVIRHDELHTTTVVLDVYHRPLENVFFDDILLGRTVISPSDMLLSTSIIEET